jgi:hypothetical protein
VVIVIPAASVAFTRPEFDDFLYALVGADRNEMPLSVLSALARLNVDPWEEASELCELPKDTAAHRLAALIARLPGGRWAQADCGAIAERLVELLPDRSRSKAVTAGVDRDTRETNSAAAMKILLCAALGLTALIMVASHQSPSRDGHADGPPSSTGSPPQSR